ncbi:LuxR C-terminal-related transcriptional regulator [Cetobacterium somerae]|uniref:LuxR C-terminal-related transcriptional regulator n=1 Tax=Cetobacterium somerae TaxID=188913 RepID=UPI00248E8268|nr:LuxR C-terminal-related transcriptional regulator [Cetobacterium somerae]
MKNLVNEEVKSGIEEIELVLELMHDMVEKILSPREFEVYILSKRMKPRHIAEKLGLKSQTVRNQINNIKNKIKNHEEWLKEKMDVRGLSI